MPTAIIISANIEWRMLRTFFPAVEQHSSSMGAWFETTIQVGKQQEQVLFFHGGWGKVSAAASAQYVIDHLSPTLLINIGTCGGFEGAIERGTIILVERTIIYDIIEMMTDADEAIAAYTTTLDLTWLAENYPFRGDIFSSMLYNDIMEVFLWNLYANKHTSHLHKIALSNNLHNSKE